MALNETDLLYCPKYNPFKEPQGIRVVVWVKFCQTEITIEICSKCLGRAIGKVLFMKIGYNLIK